MSDNKSNNNIKKVFSKVITTTPTAQVSWLNDVQLRDLGGNWEFFYKNPHSCCRDINLKMFQYKLLHRIVATNKKLKQYGIKISDVCDYCGLEVESILHLFCECDVSTLIWQQIIDWLNTHGLNLNNLTDTQILFVDKNWYPVVNIIIILTKWTIFKNKAKGKAINISTVISLLKKLFSTEHYIARVTNKLTFFRVFWSPIWNSVQ